MNVEQTGLERDPLIAEVLVEADALRARVEELGEELSRDYAGLDPLLVCVLKGAVFFLADLVRRLTVPCEIDFMAVSSYGNSTDSSGVVRILKDLEANIEGRHVIVIEDIVDSGLTLSYLLRNLRARRPASLEVCALRPSRPGARRTSCAGMSASRFPTGSRSDTGSTSASATAACPTWPPWTNRSCRTSSPSRSRAVAFRTPPPVPIPELAKTPWYRSVRYEAPGDRGQGRPTLSPGEVGETS